MEYNNSTSGKLRLVDRFYLNTEEIIEMVNAIDNIVTLDKARRQTKYLNLSFPKEINIYKLQEIRNMLLSTDSFKHKIIYVDENGERV